MMSKYSRGRQAAMDIYRHKLTIWAISVALVFFLFWEISSRAQEILDPYIVLGIGVTKQFIVLVMIIFTQKWSWRAIGVMSVMQGVAVLYIASAIFYWNQSLIPEWNEPAADLGRSFLIVGLIPLLIGVIMYAASVVRPLDADPNDVLDVWNNSPVEDHKMMIDQVRRGETRAREGFRAKHRKE